MGFAWQVIYRQLSPETAANRYLLKRLPEFYVRNNLPVAIASKLALTGFFSAEETRTSVKFFLLKARIFVLRLSTKFLNVSTQFDWR